MADDSVMVVHSFSPLPQNVIYRNLKIVLQVDQVLRFLLSYLNKTSGLPFLCLTMMPSRQDPRVTSVPVLSCLDNEKNTLVGGTIPSTNYAVAPIFQYSLWDCPDCSQFGMLRKAGWTFINLPWLESFPVHNLPSFPPPAYRASLPLKLVNPCRKVVKHIKKKKKTNYPLAGTLRSNQ